MKSDSRKSTAGKVLVSLAAFVIVVAGMRAAESILVPFLLSIFIAFISAPPLFWMKHKGLPTFLALIIVIGVVVAVLFGIAALIGTSLDDFSRSVPTYQTKLREVTGSIFAWLEEMGFEVADQEIRNQFDPSAAMNLVAGLLSGLGAALKNAFLILITVIFILMEASSFPRKLSAAFGPNASFEHFSMFRDKINRYLVIKTLVSLATGLVITIWLLILGVDFPMLWGLVAFLMNYIPTIGSILAAVPAVMLATIQLGIGPAILTAVGYLVANIVLGTLIEPRFLGRGLGLSTLVVFLSLVFWGWVLGPVGMLLSVLLTMTLKIALDSNDETRGIGILLGPDEPEGSGPKSRSNRPTQTSEA